VFSVCVLWAVSLCHWVIGSVLLKASWCLHLQYMQTAGSWRWRHYCPSKHHKPLTQQCSITSLAILLGKSKYDTVLCSCDAGWHSSRAQTDCCWMYQWKCELCNNIANCHIIQCWWWGIGRKIQTATTKYSWKTPSQCHNVQYKSKTGWPGIEHKPLWWETAEVPYNCTTHFPPDTCWILCINPLPSLTLRSARNLNVPCRPKRSKAALLTIKKADFL
jgi:hypothetical protein